MKVLLILAVLVGLAYYFFFYHKGATEPPSPVASSPAAETPATAEAPTSDASLRNSFDGIAALLRADMNAVPTALDGTGHPPVNAVAIKRRLRPYLNLHSEYQTLTQACDLIIRADAERTAFQASYRAEQGRTHFDNALEVDNSRHSASVAGHVPGGLLAATPPPDTSRAAIHQRVENSWSAYRGQTAAQVQGLLNSLAGKHL